MGSKGIHTESYSSGEAVPTKNRNGLPALGLAEGLFSKVQMRVLALLFGQPERGFQGAELIRLAASGVGAVHRELARLALSGLVTVTLLGRQKIYSANKESPVYRELRGLVVKTFGLTQPLKEVLESFSEKISLAFIYGSVARGDDDAGSDVDLMIVGEELAYPDILAALLPVEQTIGRTVSVNLLNPAEFRSRLMNKESFISRVMSLEKIMLFGAEDETHSAR